MSKWQMVRAKTDRERDCSREIIKEALSESVEYEDSQNRHLDSYLTEDTERLVRECTTDGRATGPGQIDMGLSLGTSAKYRRGWEIAFGGK
jgi:hypothetical protein